MNEKRKKRKKEGEGLSYVWREGRMKILSAGNHSEEGGRNLKITRNKSFANGDTGLMYTQTRTLSQVVRPREDLSRGKVPLLCLTSLTFIDRPLKLSYCDNFYVSLLYRAIILVVCMYVYIYMYVCIYTYTQWRSIRRHR